MTQPNRQVQTSKPISRTRRIVYTTFWLVVLAGYTACMYYAGVTPL